MAVGYARACLGDFHQAEDVAQEAFLQAYQELDALRAPAAFPGWFRRIVHKHCDRILRSRPEGRPLAEDAATESADPSGLLLAKERGLQLETAMAGLTTPERHARKLRKG